MKKKSIKKPATKKKPTEKSVSKKKPTKKPVSENNSEKKWFYYGLYRAYGGNTYNTSVKFLSEAEILKQIEDSPPNPFHVDLNWNMCNVFLHELRPNGRSVARKDILKKIYPSKHITAGFTDECIE